MTTATTDRGDVNVERVLIGCQWHVGNRSAIDSKTRASTPARHGRHPIDRPSTPGQPVIPSDFNRFTGRKCGHSLRL